MSTRRPLRYWNRAARREEEEKIYGDGPLRWLYETRAGRCLTGSVLARKWVSRLVGVYQSSPLSRRRIRSFVDEFDIATTEFVDGPYRSFNEFFARRFKPGARAFSSDPGDLPAFAEGRYVAFAEVTADQTFPVKGDDVSPVRLLGDEGRAEPFLGGPLLIARLCPVDYHRFHYPDGGTTLEEVRIPGRLHSVNPLALSRRGDILWTNERRVSVLETENFGLLAYVEVGALNVGRIVHTHPASRPFRRGDEKGYFLFGASTVLLLGEPGRWRPEADLLEKTRERREVLVRLGDRVASSSLDASSGRL